jgi:hypothetical protein
MKGRPGETGGFFRSSNDVRRGSTARGPADRGQRQALRQPLIGVFEVGTIQNYRTASNLRLRLLCNCALGGLHMKDDRNAFRAARRRALKLFGLGIAGTALATTASTDRVFANQFVGNGPVIELPEMVYDPHLQMKVNPVTRLPIYGNAGRIDIASGLPTVTSGCGNCPKKDDTGS